MTDGWSVLAFLKGFLTGIRTKSNLLKGLVVIVFGVVVIAVYGEGKLAEIGLGVLAVIGLFAVILLAYVDEISRNESDEPPEKKHRK